MTWTRRTRYSENINIAVFSRINLKPTSIKKIFKKNKKSKRNICDICIFSTKELKSVTKLRLKEVHQDCHKFGQDSRWGRNIPSSSDVDIKNSSMWYILLLSAFWNKGTKRHHSFIYDIKYIYQFLSVFISNGVYNRSLSQEKEVAWATPNSMNKLYIMYDAMHKQNNSIAVVIMWKLIYQHIAKRYIFESLLTSKLIWNVIEKIIMALLTLKIFPRKLHLSTS